MKETGYVPPPPEPDMEYRQAHHLLGSDNPLDREILESLVGRPHRFSELKPLLKAKRDHNLTMALERLRRDGLIAQRVDARRKPVVKSYELTHLGILVVLRMQQMIPAYESAQVLLRGQQAAA
jgi:DNA-binding HxlR family transcriptional regulator